MEKQKPSGLISVMNISKETNNMLKLPQQWQKLILFRGNDDLVKKLRKLLVED